MDAVATATVNLPRIYRLGAVPSKPPYPYGVFSAQLTRADSYTIDARHGLRYVRVTFQAFGRTSDSALTLTEEFIATLLDAVLTVDGAQTTPLRLELDPTPPTRDPDDGGVLGVTTTLTAIQEA
jgi:hypothetical protein